MDTLLAFYFLLKFLLNFLSPFFLPVFSFTSFPESHSRIPYSHTQSLPNPLQSFLYAAAAADVPSSPAFDMQLLATLSKTLSISAAQ